MASRRARPEVYGSIPYPYPLRRVVNYLIIVCAFLIGWCFGTLAFFVYLLWRGKA